MLWRWRPFALMWYWSSIMTEIKSSRPEKFNWKASHSFTKTSIVAIIHWLRRNRAEFVLLIVRDMHTYTRARSHSVTWKEASLACCQNFALQRQKTAVNRIIRICLGATAPPSLFSPRSPALPHYFNKSSAISAQQAAHLICSPS